MLGRLILLFAIVFAGPANAHEPNPWNEDALSLAKIVGDNYAYPERLTGGSFNLTPKLQETAARVDSQPSLLAFAENALLLLADHHAITGSSFKDSWAVVPSYSMLWVERKGGSYRITSVRKGSAAEIARIRPGDQILSVNGVVIDEAVRSFWSALGVEKIDDEHAGFAARILAAGRRNAGITIELASTRVKPRTIHLPSLYPAQNTLPGIRIGVEGDTQIIEINDALGEEATIGEFDKAMAALNPAKPLVIDLSNTPSGGNTVIARAIMGWFVDRPTFYQIHRSPAEEKRTGIARQWVEQVLPREGKRFDGPVTIRVGRWTGSMGEGLAIGFHTLGARVEGEPMAGLLGAIEDIRPPLSGLVIKIPTERLYAVDGTPREQFIPHRVEKKP